MRDEDFYFIFGYLTGILTFIGCWIYAIATYGWFLGIGVGWLPSVFIALVAGLLWPFVVIGIAIFVYLLLG